MAEETPEAIQVSRLNLSKRLFESAHTGNTKRGSQDAAEDLAETVEYQQTPLSGFEQRKVIGRECAECRESAEDSGHEEDGQDGLLLWN